MKFNRSIIWTLILAASMTTANSARAQIAPAPQSPAAAPSPSMSPSPRHVPGAAAGIEDDIRDIRGPVHIPYPWLWALYLAGGLMGAALAYAILRFWQRQKPARILLPYEVALERLDRARALIDAEKPDEFSVEVSTAVRSYIEAIFSLHAPRKTTEEFLHDLLADSSSILTKHLHLLEDFLKHCDLAKFAQWSLSKDEMEAMRSSAMRFVIETQKPPETPAIPKQPKIPEPRATEVTS